MTRDDAALEARRGLVLVVIVMGTIIAALLVMLGTLVYQGLP